jgi:hypothetical protein
MCHLDEETSRKSRFQCDISVNEIQFLSRLLNIH